MTLEGQFLTGTGVVEFSGGQHRIRTAEVDAEMVVTGGTVRVEEDTFQVTDANTRADPRVNASNRYRFALHDGKVNATAIAAQIVVGGNALVEGGRFSFRNAAADGPAPTERATTGYSKEHLQRRGLVRVVNRFTWKGGAFAGNGKLESGGGMFLGTAEPAGPPGSCQARFDGMGGDLDS